MEMMMNNVLKKRTSKGRQKIEMMKIEKRSSLQVTFSKRHRGLFNKAAELSILTGADVAVVVESPGGKVFAFGSPSPDHVFDRYLSAIQSPDNATITYNGGKQPIMEEANREKCGGNEAYWWEEDVSGLGLAQLEKYAAALEELHSKVIARANHLAAMERLTTVKHEEDCSTYGDDIFGDIDASLISFGDIWTYEN